KKINDVHSSRNESAQRPNRKGQVRFPGQESSPPRLPAVHRSAPDTWLASIRSHSQHKGYVKQRISPPNCSPAERLTWTEGDGLQPGTPWSLPLESPPPSSYWIVELSSPTGEPIAVSSFLFHRPSFER